MTETMTPCALLAGACDSHGYRPAVTVDDEVVDFDQFAECVDWVAAELQSCGLVPGARIALGVRAGWGFVLTWHALVASEAVVVPVDLCDDDAVERARELAVDFILADETHEEVLEDVVGDFLDEAAPIPVYRVADEFALVEVGGSTRPAVAGGGLISDLRSGEIEDAGQVLREADRLGRRMDLWPGKCVRLTGALNSRYAMLTIIACAAAGACASVDGSCVPADRDNGVQDIVLADADSVRIDHQRLLSAS